MNGVIVMQHFSEWLNSELLKRNWNQSDLVRAAETLGHSITSSQVSYALRGIRLPSPETCIAYASALGVSREQVFKERGWLLKESVITTKTMPAEVAEVFILIEEQPEEIQIDAARALKEVMLSIKRVMAKSGENGSKEMAVG